MRVPERPGQEHTAGQSCDPSLTSIEAARLFDGFTDSAGRWSVRLSLLAGLACAASGIWSGQPMLPALLWLAPGVLLAVCHVIAPGQLVTQLLAAAALSSLALVLTAAHRALAFSTLSLLLTYLASYREPRVTLAGWIVFASGYMAQRLLAGDRAAAAGDGALLAAAGGAWLLASALLKHRVLEVTEAQAYQRNLESELAVTRQRCQLAEHRKSEFLSNLSHEVRTPLHGVMAMTRLLLDTRLTPEQRELAETLERSNRALLDMLNDLVDYSDLETGVTVRNQPFLLSDPLDHVLEFLGPLASGKGLELLWEWDQALPSMASGDSRRLRQVLLHLVGNAVRFTDRGHVHIAVHLHAEAPASKADSLRMRYEISDTGPGIPADRAARIFEPFPHARGAVAEKYGSGGAGLGLVISKRLVESMGGEIGVSHTGSGGRGTAFWFTLPLACPPGGTAARSPRLAGKRVLVLSRSEATAATLAAQLQRYSAHAAAIWHPESAILELSRAQRIGPPYDLILADGGPDGWAAVVDWRQRVRTVSQTPVCAILPQGVELPEGEAAGFSCILRKPLRVASLERNLEIALGALPNPYDSPLEPVLIEAPAAASRRILLVEDNRLNQRIGLSILERLGYRALAVSNGREAIRALSAEMFDAILMDCQMPELDGYAATREIRALEAASGRRTPIIALTAYAVPGDRERCLEAGMDDYLAKPVLIEQVRHVLARWVETGVERPQSSSANAGL